MAYKERLEPEELKILRFLNARMELSEKEKRYLHHKEKGYEGEVLFDALTDKLRYGCLVLNDLLLESNNTKFQIDTSLIDQETIKLFEIKNFEGNYIYKSDNFYYLTGDQEILIANPLDQLKKCINLLTQLLQKLGYDFIIEGWVIFINPEFTLYQAPIDKQIILPTQVNPFMKNLDSRQSQLNGRHTKLAEKLNSLHLIDSPYDRVRSYEYHQMQTGLLCGECFSFDVSVEGREAVCHRCGKHEALDSAILRSTKEFQLLFPDKKITTGIIYDWCKVINSKKVIRKVLSRYFKCVVKGKYCYYE